MNWSRRFLDYFDSLRQPAPLSPPQEERRSSVYTPSEAPAEAIPEVTGTGAGALGFSGDAQGAQGAAGAAAGTFLLSGVGQGSQGTVGAASGILTLTGSSSGAHGVVGAGEAALSFGGGSDAVHGVSGSAEAVLSILAEAQGDLGVVGSGAGILHLEGGGIGEAVDAEPAPPPVPDIGVVGGYWPGPVPQRPKPAPVVGTGYGVIHLVGHAQGTHDPDFWVEYDNEFLLDLA